ncbi:membrane protein [Ralstonia solanacearum]|uniref:T6SS effector phospholipase Tle3 domain-containing protein n=1 Tax=Ralstonia solanacearum TaxID=305 RepID=UPI0001D963E1|nr:membrane protein [Ralstonia solanacearum]CBJ35733.1 conserved hypothethical protein [Ralstonia solanacearum PSI07]
MTAPTSPPRILVSETSFVPLFDHSELICVKRSPLPGIVIFVHGVNSDGEWFTAAEEGLCKGANRRLGRLDDQVAFKDGQLKPVHYIEGLTPDGFLNPDMSAKTYILPDPSYSPAIHFRWGYKANKEELKAFGDKIFLNEQNYWGGGPFANGCTALPDLWHEGLDTRAFGFISLQGMNPTNRPLYRTPPRAYGVLAALRLAKLIESIRKKQADVPITVVCHSQGNMVGITAAFLGDRMPEVKDPWCKSGRCVADAYVLANAPYSLEKSIGMDNWAQRETQDGAGRRGRETHSARTQTLKAFFDIIRKRADGEMDAAEIDEEMANTRTSESGGKPFNATDDRKTHGLNGKTYGRVTLYSCPHDQVISATTVRGIGWRGMSDAEVKATGGAGVFTQRVFASGFTVGHWNSDKPPVYDTWKDDWRHGKSETSGFWYPRSPTAKFGLVRALSGNETVWGTVATTAVAPVLYIVTLATSALNMMRVNADPPEGWKVTADAPKLDEPFTPQAIRYGKVASVTDGSAHSDFNEGNDPQSAARSADKADADRRTDDPYDNYKGKQADMAAQGDVGTEAAQRYEDHAIVRMRARRTGNHAWVDKDGRVIGEDGSGEMPEGYKDWQTKQVVEILDSGKNNNPSNHSTIMTNPMHAEKALAYDVAIGVNYLTLEEMNELRIEADWRFGKGLDDDHPNKIYAQYFKDGSLGETHDPLHVWVRDDKEAKMPPGIVDEREGSVHLVAGAVA